MREEFGIRLKATVTDRPVVSHWREVPLVFMYGYDEGNLVRCRGEWGELISSYEGVLLVSVN